MGGQVGIDVGKLEGSGVVGTGVGACVGMMVGTGLGSSEGVTVGKCVGYMVSNSHASKWVNVVVEYEVMIPVVP